MDLESIMEKKNLHLYMEEIDNSYANSHDNYISHIYVITKASKNIFYHW